MEKLFDSINGRELSGGNSSSCPYEQNAGTSVQNQDEIIKELCQLTDDLPSEQVPESFSTPPARTEQCQESVATGIKLQDPPVVDEILELDESLISATSHNVGIINGACQQVLREMEQQLLALLKQNRKEQDIVQNFIMSNGKVSDVSKKANIKCAGMPYFKDLDGFPPPLNEDVLKKKRRNKLLPIDFIESSPVWSNNDAKALMTAVNNTKDPNPDDSTMIDWMKISVTDMAGRYSPSECKSKWLMNLSPSVNRTKWTVKEIKSLELLADKFNYQDWDRIAAELGTNRTCLQCCVQYQAHKPPSEGKWSKEEDEALKNLIEKYRVKDHIPWIKVTWHFERRSLRQCQERYAYHLVNIKKGNFTIEEDFVLTYLATKLKNFGEVAKFLPKRVSPQVRARYEYLVEVSMPEFSKEEDEMLSELMIKYPRNWSKISEFFKDRSKVQCRRRWAHLQRNIKLATDVIDSESEDVETDQLTSEGKKNTKKEKKDTDNVVKNLGYLPRQAPVSRRYPEQYTRLLNYHKHCYKFLFGPKPRILSGAEEREKMCKKMRVTMSYMSVGKGSPSTSFQPQSLLSNCEFTNEDVTILKELQKSVGPENTTGEIEISDKIIPPNYMTLVGLRTLFLSWESTRSLCHLHKPPPDRNVRPGTRILGTDAKKLFKARMKSLFAFPLILSNIPQEGMCQPKPVSKGKTSKKSKPLSKRRRKEHSKLMTQAYREKLGKKLSEQCADAGLGEGDAMNESEEESCSGVENKAGRKRERPVKSEQPPTKRSRKG